MFLKKYHKIKLSKFMQKGRPQGAPKHHPEDPPIGPRRSKNQNSFQKTIQKLFTDIKTKYEHNSDIILKRIEVMGEVRSLFPDF